MKCLLAVITLFSWIGVAVSVPCPIPDFYNEDFEPFRSQSKTEFRTKRRLFLRCKEAYVKDSGTNWIVCQSNGEWRNYGQLQCKLRSCRLPDHTSLPHGDYEIDDNGDFTVGQRMRITCDDGYEMDTLNGSPWRRCMANGEINYEWPRCEPKRCSKPAIDDKMEVSLSIVDNWDFHHGDSVYVKCPGGYDVTGTRKSNDHIFCKSGSWSKEFKCEEKTCQDPDIIDGYVEKSASNDEKCEEKWFSGCQADVKCVEGAAVRNYEDRTIVCSSDGFWDNVPQCYKYCTSDSITNGYLESDSYRRERVIKNGEKGTYHCDWGYKRDTDYDEVKCMFSVAHVRSSYYRDWNTRDYEYNDAPSCKEKPTTLRSASGTAYYNSADGSIISGYSTELEHGTSVRMECDPGYQIPEGYESEAVVYFRASFGEWKYLFNGQRRNDTNQPNCEEAPCTVPTIANTEYKERYGSQAIVEGSVNSQTDISVTCDPQYEIQEGIYDGNMQCDKGAWKPKELICSDKRSCEFKNPNRKTLRLNENVENEGYKIHDKDLSIKCATGYEFKRDIYPDQYELETIDIRCQYGDWMYTDTYGDEHIVSTECKAKPCGKPTAPDTVYSDYRNDVVTREVASDFRVKVHCTSGDYEVAPGVDSGTMTCVEGAWEGGFKQCQPKSCDFKQPSYAARRVMYANNNTRITPGYRGNGHKMFIKCDSGYEVNRHTEQARIQCQYGRWVDTSNQQHIDIQCTEKPCLIPNAAHTTYFDYQGEIEIFDNEVRSGARVTVKCINNQYEVDPGEASGKMKCNRGEWQVRNSEDVYEWRTGSRECKAKTCRIDYEHMLRNNRDNEHPIRRKSFDHEDALPIKCADGYEFAHGITSMNITCNYGEWLSNGVEVTPLCGEKPCRVRNHDNTEYRINGQPATKVQSGDYVDVSCAHGYQLGEGVASGTMDCVRGSWVGDDKWCVEESCTVSTQPGTQFESGNTMLRGGFSRHESTVTVSCTEGYSLVHGGDILRVKCQYGNWRNGIGPVVTDFCKQDTVRCQLPEDDNTIYTRARNGDTLTQDSVVRPGHRVKVKCKSDQYEIAQGETDMECRNNDLWDQELRCQPIQPKSCVAKPARGAVLIESSTNATISKDTPIPHGGRVRLVCRRRYRLEKIDSDERNFLVAVCKSGQWVYFKNQSENIQYLKCFADECQLEETDKVKYFKEGEEIRHIALGWNSSLTYKCHDGAKGKVTCRFGQWTPPVKCVHYRAKPVSERTDRAQGKKTRRRNGRKRKLRRKTANPKLNGPIGCASSPCQNGGMCEGKEDGGYKCACDRWRYFGLNCESTKGCADSPCQNGGTCVDEEDGGYKCVCFPKLNYGVNCEKVVNATVLCSRDTVINVNEIKLYRHGGGNLLNGTAIPYTPYYMRNCLGSNAPAFYIRCDSRGKHMLDKRQC